MKRKMGPMTKVLGSRFLTRNKRKGMPDGTVGVLVSSQLPTKIIVTRKVMFIIQKLRSEEGISRHNRSKGIQCKQISLPRNADRIVCSETRER